MLDRVKEFIQKETVLCIAALCAVATMFLIPPDWEYLHYIDFRVLCLLLCLMAVVAGFKSVGAFQWLTYKLIRCIRSGRALTVTLVMLPFFSSMLVTNDVALLVFVPFTLGLLTQLGCTGAVVPMLVLQTVAANLGSMATPVGNPQNLYLYAAYDLLPGEFFFLTLPLTVVSFVFLFAAALPVLPGKLAEQKLNVAQISSVKELLIYGALFVLCLLTVFRVVPYPVTTILILAILAVIRRELLKEIDFMLLLTFICFFVVSENLGRMEVVRMFLADLLVGVAFFVVSLVLGLLGAIPYLGVLFVLVLCVLAIAYIALAPLFMGLLQAAFYEEISNPTVIANVAVVGNCANCGAPLAAEAKFCPSCGKSVEE